MKAFSKISVILICICLIFTLSACGDNNTSTGSSATPIPSASTPTSTAPNDSTSIVPNTSATTTTQPSEDAELTYLKPGDVYKLYHWWLQPGNESQEFRDGESLVSEYRANTLDTLRDTYGVTIEFIANTGSYFDEVCSSAYTGTPIADGMHGGNTPQAADHYWYQGIPGSCLEPISDHNISFDDDSYWDVAQQNEFCTFNDKLYGFVMNRVGMKSVETAKVTFFNYNLVQEAGYTPAQLYQMVKDKTWNWDVYKEIAIATTDPDRGIYGTTWYDLGLQLAMSNNGKIISTSTENGESYDVFTGYDSNSVKAWDFLKELYDGGYTCPLTEGTSDNAIVNLFRNGRVTFMVNYWRRTFDGVSGELEDCGYLPVPMGPDATEYVAEDAFGECFMIFKGCTNPDGLLKAMKMLYRPIYAKGSVENDQLFSSEVGQYCQDKESLDFLNNLQYMTVQSKAVYYGINWHYMSIESTTKILTGEVTPAQYFESVAPTYNEMINKILHR